jgi:lipoprotein signal peptidase
MNRVTAAVLVALILVAAADQALKALVRNRLACRSISLGRFGQLRAVSARIWIARLPGGERLSVVWGIWASATWALAIVYTLIPSAGWAAGAILGASLSHAVDMSLRGMVCDYVCVRRGPAFNLADVALVVAGCGLLVECFLAMQPWPIAHS